MQQLDRRRTLPHAGRRARSSPAPAAAPGAGRSRGRAWPRTRSPARRPRAARGPSGARQPRVDQDGQVLLVLLLEFLDHQLAAPGRRPPVDPARAVAGAIVAQAVVFHLLRRAVVPLAAAVLGRLTLHLKPAARETPDPWDRPRSGRSSAIVVRCSTSPNGDRVPMSRSRNAILAALGAPRLPADPRAIATRDPREENPRRDHRCSRNRAIDRNQRVFDKERQRRMPAPAVLERVIDDQRVARKDIAGHAPHHAQPAQHVPPAEDRGQERARRQA